MRFFREGGDPIKNLRTEPKPTRTKPNNARTEGRTRPNQTYGHEPIALSHAHLGGHILRKKTCSYLDKESACQER